MEVWNPGRTEEVVTENKTTSQPDVFNNFDKTYRHCLGLTQTEASSFMDLKLDP